MSAPRIPKQVEVLHPTTTTTYSISTYTSTSLLSADNYRVICENAYVTLTAKSATAFTLTVSVQSPVVTNTAWLEFLNPVDPPA